METRLRIKLAIELLIIDFISILLIFVISILPANALRIILGFPFILFFPGYTLIAALFPRKTELSGTERAALSFGLSIAVALLIGLVMNYTPWGIELYSLLSALTVFILLTSLVAWHRRLRCPSEESFSIALNLGFLRWTAISHWDKILSIFLILLILGATGSLAYALVTPKSSEKFTEFYVLGPDGTAENYPKELVVGEEFTVILGIVNHEHEDSLAYRVEIVIQGETVNVIGPLVLDNEERWENEVSFILQRAGKGQKLEFILYKQGEDSPSGSLHLWLDIKEG
jgi:uncharacterized membrane protein